MSLNTSESQHQAPSFNVLPLSFMSFNVSPSFNVLPLSFMSFNVSPSFNVLPLSFMSLQWDGTGNRNPAKI